MERDTTQIVEGAHTYDVKTYATAREANAIQQAYFKGTKVEVVGDQPKFSDFNAGVVFDVRQEMIRQMVVSMDGSAETIVERCLELPNAEFEQLIADLDAIVAKKKELAEAISHYSMGRSERSMQMLAIMQEFGWTYQEFMETPNYVITLIIEKMVRDRKAQELAAKQSNHG